MIETQKDELFEKLTPNQKFNLLKFELDQFLFHINERMRTLPLISALAATLLVVATFNEKLIPVNSVVKILLSLLLFLIPVSLFLYNRDLKKAQQNSLETIKSYLRDENLDKDLGISAFDKIAGLWPDIAIWVIALVIFVLLIILWGGESRGVGDPLI